MKHFLTQEQSKELADKDWSVNPEGFYLVLYAREFERDAWVNMCAIVGCSNNVKTLKILSFGYATN